MTKVVKVDDAVHARLMTLTGPGETVGQTISRALEKYNPFEGHGEATRRLLAASGTSVEELAAENTRVQEAYLAGSGDPGDPGDDV